MEANGPDKDRSSCKIHSREEVIEEWTNRIFETPEMYTPPFTMSIRLLKYVSLLLFQCCYVLYHCCLLFVLCCVMFVSFGWLWSMYKPPLAMSIRLLNSEPHTSVAGTMLTRSPGGNEHPEDPKQGFRNGSNNSRNVNNSNNDNSNVNKHMLSIIIITIISNIINYISGLGSARCPPA